MQGGRRWTSFSCRFSRKSGRLYTLFRDQVIHVDIMCFVRNGIDDLSFHRDAARLAMESVEYAVIKSAAMTESCAILAKSESWAQDEVDLGKRDFVVFAGVWF